MKEPILLIMAAGMGSRYGGSKQIDPVGNNGEIIIDYSLYDAVQAGFKKAVFVIKEENAQDFKELVLPRAGRYMEVQFAYQKLSDVPEGCRIPQGREKPWGTGQAVLAARKLVDAPFVVINADDFYGREAFEKMYWFLKNADSSGNTVSQYAMVGYHLENTVTENGSVARGICQTENGKLKTIVERTKIEKRADAIAYTEDEGKTWTALAPQTTVSMNLFGFTTDIFTALENDFRAFFKNDVPKNPLKAELFLPFVVNDQLAAGKAEVSVLSSKDQWYGVTYKADRETVIKAISEMTDAGIYPRPLWK